MSTRQKLLIVLFAVIWSILGYKSFAMAQRPFPARPVTLWVGFPAGGVTDIIMRALADSTEKSLGQKIVVINKPGASSTICTSLLAKEKPDGYTIAGILDMTINVYPHLTDLDYDTFRDLSYIIRIASFRNVVAVKADSPFKKWEDVVEWAKKNPGQLIVGAPGISGTPFLATAKIAKKEGFTFKYVPFGGDAPLVNALLGGHLMVAASSSVVFKSHVEAKTARVLLVFERMGGLDYAPGVPTFEEMHYDFDTPINAIILAPKGIPDPIREILERAFLEGMKQEKFIKIAKDQDLNITEPLTGKAFLDYLKKYYLIYEEMTKEAGTYKAEKRKK